MKAALHGLPLTWWHQSQPRREALWRGWNRHWGWPAAVAVGLLTGAVLLHLNLRPHLLREQAQLQERQRALAAAQTRAAAQNLSTAAPVTPSTDGLPTPRQRGRDLERLVSAAQRHGLLLERADYATSTQAASGPLRVEATVPLSGTYIQLKMFIAEVLNELPHAALESLLIERPDTRSQQLQATARVVFFYREDKP